MAGVPASEPTENSCTPSTVAGASPSRSPRPPVSRARASPLV